MKAPVQVWIAGSFHVKVLATEIKDGFVVDHEWAVTVLQRGVCRQDRVVWLHNRSGNLCVCTRWNAWREIVQILYVCMNVWLSYLRRRINTKLQLWFLAIINWESFHHKRCKTTSGSASEGVEDEEALQATTLLRQLPGSIHEEVNDLLSDCVVASSVVVGCIFLSCYQLFGVE